MTEFVIEGKSKKLSVALRDKYSRIGYDTIYKLFRKGEIRVNGKKVFSDIFVKSGDVIRVYGVDPYLSPKSVYEDDNIVIYYKPPKIASVGVGSFDEVVRENNPEYVICHRLDTNTDGLLIFAKNEKIAEEIKRCFADHEIKKMYFTVVSGEVEEYKELKAYLKKDAELGTVKIFDSQVTGSEEIITKINPLEAENGLTLLEVELVTGKTHQIRAHLAHENLPIIGDSKYGNNETNRHYKKKYQMLHAYKITFSITDGPLSYLNGKTVSLDEQKYHDEFSLLISHL